MQLKTKKYGIILGTGLLLIVAIYANYRLNAAPIKRSDENEAGSATISKSIDSDTRVSSDENYFSVFKENREAVRKKEIEYLDAIINNSKTDAETLTDAQQQKIAIVDGMEKEFAVESLLVAKGFDEAAVTIHKGSVNIIVDKTPLTSEQVAQILDIVIRETGETAENIKVTAKT